MVAMTRILSSDGKLIDYFAPLRKHAKGKFLIAIPAVGNFFKQIAT
jgi:hypothetical protein